MLVENVAMIFQLFICKIKSSYFLFIKINLFRFQISDLQHGAYPLIAPRNESFPETYITTRHDLIPTTFNRTKSNKTIQLINPLRGTWFALVDN